MSLFRHQFCSNALYALVCSALTGFFAYLVRRLTANGLSGNEYAFFYSIFSLISISIAVVSFGIPNAAFFCLPDYLNQGLKEEAREVYSFCLRWFLATGLLLSAAVFPVILIAGNNIGRYEIQDKQIFYFLLLLPLPLYLSNTIIQILNGLKQFFLSNLLLVLNFALVLVGVFLFQKPYGLRAVTVAYPVAAVCIASIGLIVCHKRFGYSISRRVSSPIVRRMLKTGWWLFLSDMGYYFFMELGNVILSYVGTPEETVKFNIAMPVAVIVRSLAVVSGVFAPYSNELFHRREYRTLRRIVWIVLAVTLIMIICVSPLFLLFGEPLIAIFFGDRFVSASSCLLFLIIAVFFWNAARFFTDMLNSMRHEHVSAFLSLGVALLAGILYFALCPSRGADGAALGALIASCVWMVSLTGLMLFFLRGHHSEKGRKVIVFMAGSSIGDTLISFPALKAIRRHYPDAEITLFGYSPYRGVGPLSELTLKGGAADRVIGFQEEKSLLKNAWHYLQFFWIMYLAGYDVAINIGRTAVNKYQQKVKRWRLWCRCCGIPVLQGDKNLFIFPPKEKDVPLPMVPNHIELIAERLKADGIVCELDRIDLMLSREELENAEKIWSGINLPSGSIPVAVGIGGNQLRWSVSRYGEVIKTLQRDYPVLPLFFGGPENMAEIDALVSSCGGINVSRLPLSGLRETVAFMMKCAFFVGNDTGTLHMAVAAGLKCVGVYSAHNYPGEWYPWGDGHIVLRKSMPCDGCMSHPCPQLRCMLEISVAEVVDATRTMLETIRRS